MVYYGCSWSINMWGLVGHFWQNDIKLLNPRLSRGRRKKVFICVLHPVPQIPLWKPASWTFISPALQGCLTQALRANSGKARAFLCPVHQSIGAGLYNYKNIVQISLQASCPGSGQDGQTGGYSKIIWYYIWTVYGADKVRSLKMLELKFFKIAVFYSITSSSKLI